MNTSKIPEASEDSYGLLREIFSLRTDVDLRHGLSLWRSHLLKRSFERLASDIDPESGLDSAMVRLHHHFAVELPITEIGSILPGDEDSVKGVEDLNLSAFRPLFAIREKIATCGYSDQVKFELGESLRKCLTSVAAEPLAKYEAVAEKGLRDHCPGNSFADRKGDGGFDFSEIIDKITR